jgi:hypothetical protein
MPGPGGKATSTIMKTRGTAVRVGDQALKTRHWVLVTFNTRDFPLKATGDYDIEVVHPDDFLLDQLDLYPGITVAALRDQAESYDSPAMTVEDLLGRLAAAGVPRFASEARRHL